MCTGAASIESFANDLNFFMKLNDKMLKSIDSSGGVKSEINLYYRTCLQFAERMKSILLNES